VDAEASLRSHAAHLAAPAARVATPRSRVRLAVAGGILAAGAAGAVVWMTQRAPETNVRGASTTSGAAESGGAGAGGATGMAATNAATDSAATPAAVGENETPSRVGAASDSVASAGDSPATRLAAELDSQITRQTALARVARARAVAAGARGSTLSEGDSLLKSALAWRARGELTKSLRDGLGAAQSWALAERAAEAARQTASRPSGAVAEAPATPPSETPAAPSRGADQPRQAAPESASPVQPTAGTAGGAGAAGANEAAAAAAAGALRDYVSALSRRDLSAMRRSWPTMPAGTSKGLQSLFEEATSFSASLSEDPAPRVSGSAADAELRYSLDYFIPSQGAVKQSFRVHVVMRRDGDRWTIRSLEPVR
jgi:hypothetical protein